MVDETKASSLNSAQDMNLRAACRFVAEGSKQPMAAIESEAHLVRYANPAFRKLFDREDSELIGRRFESALPARIARFCKEPIDRVYKTGIAESIVEQLGQDDTQGLLDAEWSGKMWPVLDADDNCLGVMIQLEEQAPSAVFAKGVTKMNEALLLAAVRQHELREGADQMNDQLMAQAYQTEESQRALRHLAAVLDTKVRERTVELERANLELQSFAYSMAHDLRSPLRTIVSASKILLVEARGYLSSEHADLIDRQAYNASKLATLIDDLLLSARLADHPLARTTIDLTAMAKEQVSALETRLTGQ
jgi:signal transduction histidine kinase